MTFSSALLMVIADDLSGAAEIAGRALEHGLTTEVWTWEKFLERGTQSVRPSLLVIDSNTRSSSKTEARNRLRQLGKNLEPSPIRLFKKVDSVLRGPLISELNGLTEGLSQKRVLLVPSNPSRERVVRQGQYWIKNKPIHKTQFGKDPEYPAQSSHVVDILRSQPGDLPVSILPPNSNLTNTGILVGEATTLSDLDMWVKELDENTLAAGAADFFQAWLQLHAPQKRNSAVDPLSLNISERVLLVSGSASTTSSRTIESWKKKGTPVLNIPTSLLENENNSDHLIRTWMQTVIKSFQLKSRVVVNIGHPLKRDVDLKEHLRLHLAELTSKVLSNCSLDHLWVEGGSTASTLVRHLKWNQFEVLGSLSPGVVTLRQFKKELPLITLKPGSYAWPDVFCV